MRNIKFFLSTIFILVIACGGTTSPPKTPEPTQPPAVEKANWGSLDIRDLVKGPSRYIGHQVKFDGEIFTIQEIESGTFMQVWIDVPDSSHEAVVVLWPHTSAHLYKGTQITFWGTVQGTFEGENAFGATILQPKILAKYIEYSE